MNVELNAEENKTKEELLDMIKSLKRKNSALTDAVGMRHLNSNCSFNKFVLISLESFTEGAAGKS